MKKIMKIMSIARLKYFPITNEEEQIIKEKRS
jgi:hypothetical protein